MPPEIMHKPQQSQHSEDAASSDTVLLAGRHIHLLPGRQGRVGSDAAAVNDVWAAPKGLPLAPRVWQGLWRAVRGLKLLLAPRHRLTTLPAEYAVVRGSRPQRWPATWPYADCAMAPGRSNMFPSGDASWTDMAPDAIVDREGRILRL